MLDTILGNEESLGYTGPDRVQDKVTTVTAVKGGVPGMTQTLTDVPAYVNESDASVCCPGTTQNHTAFSENRASFLRNMTEYI